MDSPWEIITRKAAGDKYVGFTIPSDALAFIKLLK